MNIYSYQSQSYSSDANDTLRCNRCMTTDHDIINTTWSMIGIRRVGL